MSFQYVSSTGSHSSHTRGRSRSRNSPPRVAMPSPHFPISGAPSYYAYPTSEPGHAHGHARHASYGGHGTPGTGNTFYVARSPSRSGHRRSGSHNHRHHRSHSATPHRSSSAAPRHSSHARHSSKTRHRSSSNAPHRSQSAHHVQRRNTYSQPQRRYSTHYTNHLSFADRIRKMLHIGRFGSGRTRYVDSRGRELDRDGRVIIKY